MGEGLDCLENHQVGEVAEELLPEGAEVVVVVQQALLVAGEEGVGDIHLALGIACRQQLHW